MQNSIGDGIGTVLVQLFTIMLSLVLVTGTVSANHIKDPRESIRYFRPTAIAFDDQGTAYFSNRTNIVVFAEDESIREMGRGGREPGCFNNCTGITVIGQNIFVADTNNNRIQVLDLSGEYQYSIGELGQLNRPQDVLLFGEFILVADGGNNRIQGFTHLGDVLFSYGEKGAGQGQFNQPVALAADSNGRVYVADRGNRRLVVLESSGHTPRYLEVINLPGVPVDLVSITDGVVVAVGNRLLKYDFSGDLVAEYTGASYGGLPTIQGLSLYRDQIAVLAGDNVYFLDPSLKEPVIDYAVTGEQTVTICWETSFHDIGVVEYGRYARNPSQCVTSDYGTKHQVSIQGLQPERTYIYYISPIITTLFPEPHRKVELTMVFRKFADLDVLYISRTPRYERFTVTYDEHGPASYSGGLWPSVGAEVLFTAVVGNKGNLTSSPFTYQWWIDDQLVESGSYPAMPPGHRQEFSIPWQWPEEAGQVQFVVLAEDVSNELSERNNSRRIWTDALSFKFFVEPGVYEAFNSLKNMTGTYSFEDWAWAHIGRMNEMFEQCGVVESVFIDEVEVLDNLPNVGEHAPLALEWDGRWGWDDREWTPNKIEREMGAVQYTLIHELMHQLGIIDEYNFNFDPNYQDRNEVNQEIYWYPYKGIMNDLNSRTLSTHTQKALNANKGFRRGFFGEYLYDLPRHNTIILKDQEGNVLSHAKIKIYQTDSNRIPNEPVIEGMTDVHGRFILPNREVSKEITTPTGHQLRANPFGQINVVGLNGLFLCEAQLDGNKVYGWLGIWEFNLAYWNGNKEAAEYTVVVR